ncbi:ABC transporter ATP-binding protein [Bradyrhizobium sp. KB893862 SZCCT0404]|uniref:ABC transporter ATP-binding protein n=1 Tax=Bradyrhizobium sp. KB893862 SZCCT0404 TaxID=2807672 RepID=UPI001BA868D9|nr:ABC transporter ATP-binding protein [Bradyrhizobium sp. KB893862 SZCCT0404]MBR1177196.1 ABC transporter ATP-binding protein [Bradyrhizobium sp. KB893862 SZCCT0404]
MSEPILRAVDLAKHYPVEAGILRRGRKLLRAVDGVSFDVVKGETLSLVGESGCGKSTTGRMLVRLIEPTSGHVEFEGARYRSGTSRGRAPRRIQFVFQDPYASLNPRMTAGDAVGEPLLLHDIVPRPQRAARIAELLDMVGLPASFAARYPHELSGGQRQRVGIARSLALEPSFIVCDEAVSALDVSVQAQILNLLKTLKMRLGLSLLFIAHDLAVVKHISDRIAVMYLGRLVEVAATSSLFSGPRHPYTRALLGAIPKPSFGHARAATISGDIPSPIDPPSGCRFHTRCPLKADICTRVEPPMEAIASGHTVACHRWREVAPMQAAARADDDFHQERIQRLLGFFQDRPASAAIQQG